MNITLFFKTLLVLLVCCFLQLWQPGTLLYLHKGFDWILLAEPYEPCFFFLLTTGPRDHSLAGCSSLITFLPHHLTQEILLVYGIRMSSGTCTTIND
jgi:hypothetical protein